MIRKQAAKKPGAKKASPESPSGLIDARIKELGDWRGKTLARVRALIKEADPGVAKNPLIFPHKETLDKAHVFKSLSPDEETKFNQLFADLTGTG